MFMHEHSFINAPADRSLLVHLAVLTLVFAPAALCRGDGMGGVLAKVRSEPEAACAVLQVFSRSVAHWQQFLFIFAFKFLDSECSGGARTRVNHVYNCCVRAVTLVHVCSK